MLSPCTQSNICWRDPYIGGTGLMVLWKTTAHCFDRSRAPALLQSNSQVKKWHNSLLCNHILSNSTHTSSLSQFLLHSLEYFSLSVGAEKTNRTTNKLTILFVIPPQCIKNSPIGEDADKSVLHGDIMEEWLLGVHDKGVGDPEELHKPSVKT